MSPLRRRPYVTGHVGAIASYPVVEANILEINRLSIDAPGRGRDPVRHLAGLQHRLGHQRGDIGAVGGTRQPLLAVPLPFGGRDDLARGRDRSAGKGADLAVEAAMGQVKAEGDLMLADEAIPALDPLFAVGDVVIAQPLVEGGQGRRFQHLDRIRDQLRHLVMGVLEDVVIVELALAEAALEAHRVVIGGVGRQLLPEQVERDRVVEVQVALQRRQVDDAEAADIVGVVLAHDLAGTLDDAGDAAFAHEHVVGFLGQHEAAGAGERIEAGFGERQELVLAVAVGEEGEHVEGEPVIGALVEGTEDARLLGIARMALQHRLRLFATVAAEIGVEQIDHRPQMPAFLDIDLEQVAQVIERGAGMAELALLLDRGGLGIALGHDQPA
jgi:hypothetical protein